MATSQIVVVQNNPCEISVSFIDDTGLVASFKPVTVLSAAFVETASTPSGAQVPSQDRLFYDNSSRPSVIIIQTDVPFVPGLEYQLNITGSVTVDGVGSMTSPSVVFTAESLPRAGMLKTLFPSVFDTEKPIFKALLTSLAYVDEMIGGYHEGAAARRARHDTLLSDATGSTLDRCAENYHVQRPTFGAGDDDVFRKLAMVLGVAPKATRKVFQDVLDILIGPGYAIYETGPGLVVVEVPPTALDYTADQIAASYFKTLTTVAADNNRGDYLMRDATVTGAVGGRSLVFYSPTARTVDTSAVLALVKAAGIQITIVQKS